MVSGVLRASVTSASPRSETRAPVASRPSTSHSRCAGCCPAFVAPSESARREHAEAQTRFFTGSGPSRRPVLHAATDGVERSLDDVVVCFERVERSDGVAGERVKREKRGQREPTLHGLVKSRMVERVEHASLERSLPGPGLVPCPPMAHPLAQYDVIERAKSGRSSCRACLEED